MGGDGRSCPGTRCPARRLGHQLTMFSNSVPQSCHHRVAASAASPGGGRTLLLAVLHSHLRKADAHCATVTPCAPGSGRGFHAHWVANVVRRWSRQPPSCNGASHRGGGCTDRAGGTPIHRYQAPGVVGGASCGGACAPGSSESPIAASAAQAARVTRTAAACSDRALSTRRTEACSAQLAAWRSGCSAKASCASCTAYPCSIPFCPSAFGTCCGPSTGSRPLVCPSGIRAQLGSPCHVTCWTSRSHPSSSIVASRHAGPCAW